MAGLTLSNKYLARYEPLHIYRRFQIEESLSLWKQAKNQAGLHLKCMHLKVSSAEQIGKG